MIDTESEYQKSKIYKELKIKREKDIDFVDDLIFILKSFDIDGIFDDYEIIEKVFNSFNFSIEEQAEIYAYFLNSTINYILNFQKNHPDRIRNVSKAAIDKKLKMPKFVKGLIADIVLQQEERNQQKDCMYCKHLRNIISEEGDIIPFEYASDFKWVFKKFDFRIPEHIIDMILNESANRYKVQKEEAKKENEAKIKAEELIKKQIELEKQKNNTQIWNDKIKKNALQKLKLYLVNDQPICYVNDLEFERIDLLLRQCGLYTETQIIKIKTAIRNNNDRIAALEREQKINSAINILLAESEAQILSEAKNIFENDSKIVSGKIIKDINESYNSILNLLLNLYEVKDKDNTYYNDFAEYLIMSIEELNDLINSYKSCNYELLLSLKESN